MKNQMNLTNPMYGIKHYAVADGYALGNLYKRP